MPVRILTSGRGSSGESGFKYRFTVLASLAIWIGTRSKAL